jgi:hypothetical protein
MRCPRRIIYLVFFTVIISCNEKKDIAPDCSHLKTGRYEYRNPYGKGSIQIERNDSVQVETGGQAGNMTFRIEWLSPCVYTLEFLSASDEEHDRYFKSRGLALSETTIDKVTRNYYICNTTRKGQPDRTDTILIMK